ncbi:hypothetical protein NDU88_001440 [Pleurodeles waltl]|uniref:Uncharacterized protein n=1 Tax=Pleurodeles waltl TaxID=8319 RepID=A0AAV7LBA6_PLEWA|nr:hypothetical protein NDU88_001440 [Pleurodeles waltl]
MWGGIIGVYAVSAVAMTPYICQAPILKTIMEGRCSIYYRRHEKGWERAAQVQVNDAIKVSPQEPRDGLERRTHCPGNPAAGQDVAEMDEGALELETPWN